MKLEEAIEEIVKEPIPNGYRLNDQTVYKLVALFQKWALEMVPEVVVCGIPDCHCTGPEQLIQELKKNIKESAE